MYTYQTRAKYLKCSRTKISRSDNITIIDYSEYSIHMKIPLTGGNDAIIRNLTLAGACVCARTCTSTSMLRTYVGHNLWIVDLKKRNITSSNNRVKSETLCRDHSRSYNNSFWFRIIVDLAFGEQTKGQPTNTCNSDQFLPSNKRTLILPPNKNQNKSTKP